MATLAACWTVHFLSDRTAASQVNAGSSIPEITEVFQTSRVQAKSDMRQRKAVEIGVGCTDDKRALPLVLAITFGTTRRCGGGPPW